MTVVRPNSISGITSITAQTDTINFFKSDGSLAGLLLGGVNLNTSSGVSTFNVLKVGTATTLDSSGINITGVVTATSFRGDGSNLTGVAATSNIRTNAIVNSGVTTVSAGTTAIPSISPSGDPNTGIFFPDADTIAFTEGGVEVLRIDSSSNVAIGTGASGGKLTVKGGTTQSGGQLNLTVQSSDSSNIPATITQSDSSSTLHIFSGGLAPGSARGGQIDFVAGAASTNPGTLIFRTGTTSGGTPVSERMRIDSSGNVGIGTTNAFRALSIQQNSDTAIFISAGNANANSRAYELVVGGNSSNNAEFLIRTRLDNGTGGTERLRIDANGRLGINSSSPTSTLDVIGDVKISGIGTATEFVSTSDITLKENITVIDNPLIKLSELRGVTFDWKKGGSSVGVIAQDVEKVLPQAVRGEENNKAVNYNGIIGLLVESIKQQQKEIDELKSRLDK